MKESFGQINANLSGFSRVEDIFEGVTLKLKKSENLDFLKEDKKVEDIFDKEYWSLYEGERALEPLRFSNGKSQEDVVKEIVELIRGGKKLIFLHGMCGTGKSAIALNIARALGKAAVVVPVKNLQRQYEEEYMGKKHVVKNERRMKIAMITGRENHDSLIFPGKSCADSYLPDTIKITDKNREKLKEYYRENPFISSEVAPGVKSLKRISIAPANPYWSPILPAEIELNHLSDAKKRMYEGMFGKKFVFYHRKKGCSYYDQYLSYFDADVIIYNSAKYLSEVSFGRKPMTEVDIIDEADEFLDKLSNSVEINLTRLRSALNVIIPENPEAKENLNEILRLIDMEEKNKKALGIDEGKVYSISETKILKILKLLLSDLELGAEIAIDEMNYGNSALEAAREFEGSFEDIYLTYRKEDDFLYATLVTTDLSKRFGSIVEGNKALVLMSGTLHSEEVMKHIYGVEDFVNVDAEVLPPGLIEISKTGREFDCKYSNFKSGRVSRDDYLKVLSLVVSRAEKPALVHVNAFNDLPNLDDEDFGNLVLGEELKLKQIGDKLGLEVSKFKKGEFDVLFSTKCSRGVDFPGDSCKSVIFTKYPNPNVRDVFWRVLQKTHPDYYWEFYRDKAHREFLQRIYRAVRSPEDKVFVLSPDARVLEAVRRLQER
jgi:Rad3-related DNA helicase